MKVEFNYQIENEVKTVAVEREGNQFRVQIGARTYRVSAWSRERGELSLEVESQRCQAYVARAGTRRYVALAGQTWVLERSPLRQARRRLAVTGPQAGNLAADMPGLVLDVLVAEGDEVARGETLVLLEAMKMELRIAAPSAGRVRKVYCVAGQIVERGQVLVELGEVEGE